VLVERDLQNVGMLCVQIPVDVVNGLHVIAGRIDLLLQTSLAAALRLWQQHCLIFCRGLHGSVQPTT
jgi:hypothetical protein